MNFKRKLCAAGAAAALIAVPAQASLVNLGDGTVWDSATNLVWLKDWNVNGLADPNAQYAWAQDLVFAGASNWVLPGWAQMETVRNHAPSFAAVDAIFDHVSNDYYWSSTGAAPDQCYGDNLPAKGGSPGGINDFPWGYSMRSGVTDCVTDVLRWSTTGLLQSAVAVRTGGVLATVPEPQTLLLSLLGLGALGLARRQGREPQRGTYAG